MTKIPLPTPSPPGDRFCGTPSKMITDILQHLPAKFGACTRFGTISAILGPNRPDYNKGYGLGPISVQCLVSFTSLEATDSVRVML